MRTLHLFRKILPFAPCIFLLAAPGCRQAKEARISEVNGIRFRIPLAYKQQKREDPKLAAFEYVGEGPYSALLKVSFEQRPASIVAPPLAVLEATGLKITGERKLSVAGKDGGCVEFLNTKSKTGLVQAECWFGNDLHASFSGSPECVEDFYVFLQTAKPAGKEPT